MSDELVTLRSHNKKRSDSLGSPTSCIASSASRLPIRDNLPCRLASTDFYLSYHFASTPRKDIYRHSSQEVSTVPFPKDSAL